MRVCRVGLNSCGVSRHATRTPVYEVRSSGLTSDGVSAGSHCLLDCCLCSVHTR